MKTLESVLHEATVWTGWSCRKTWSHSDVMNKPPCTLLIAVLIRSRLCVNCNCYQNTPNKLSTLYLLWQLLALANGDRVKDKLRGRNSFVVDMDKKLAAEKLLNELLSFHGATIRQVISNIILTSMIYHSNIHSPKDVFYFILFCNLLLYF